jgi:cbb3-type cytochrome oxidase subunit 3
MSKDSDEFDWVFFILIPGATLMFVLCLLCCAIWALRLRKQHRKEEDDGQLVNVNDEESQKQEPSKAMTPSPSSATAQTPKLASTTLAETDAVIFVVDSNDQAELRDVAIVTNDSI